MIQFYFHTPSVLLPANIINSGVHFPPSPLESLQTDAEKFLERTLFSEEHLLQSAVEIVGG